MSTARVTFEPLDLPLQNPFGISRRTTTVARNVLVRVELDGLVGYGEAGPNAYYGESQESVLAWLPKLVDVLPENPLEIHRAVTQLEHAAHHNPAARAGLELALWDLVGKRYGAPVWKLWGIDERVPLSSFTIGIDTPEKMGEKATAAAEYPLLKVKVGTADDVARLGAIREARPDARIQIDANGAWSAKEAIGALPRLEQFDIELIEQPVRADDLDGLCQVSRATRLPVYADEGCVTARDVARVAGRCDGIVVKLQKCGGLLPALQHVQTARAYGLKVMMGCMVESGLGIAAATQLAPLCDSLDLDGNLLLARDPFDAVAAHRGQLTMPTGPGLGAVLRS
ncbi:MAG: dipeptide epimerase [Chloroflexi bacterium]|nr:dipeptide epimerase [Chloroflexota bacterium]